MTSKEKKRVQFVIKSSKFCNLRCRYCYEYAELGNREAIAPEQLDKMYAHIASYYSRLDRPVDIQFIWHGGEPLLQHPDYYWRTFDRQQQIFGELASSVTNTVQTNLTVLNNKHIHLLREGFDGVGVSVDLFGGLRVNQADKDSLQVVLANMDRLQSEKINFGCITVLTKLNLPYLEEIYKFYEKIKIPFRVLPLFNGAFDGQHQGYEIDANEVLNAYRTLFDLWLESKSSVRVRPIIDYIKPVIRHYIPNAQPDFYNKREWEYMYLVNVNGDIYSYADAYNSEFCHGNLFETPLENIVLSAGHEKAIMAAEKRMASACHSCEYFGRCSGYPVAEESVIHNQVDTDGNAQCTKEKGIFQYIEKRFKETGIINPITRKVNINQDYISKHILGLDIPG